MLDALGRDVNYLRISVTQRCNLHCMYCGADCPDTGELTAEEISRITAAFVKEGVTKVRLTGGEPLLRRDIAEIAAGIRAVPGVKKLVLTTNGVLLAEQATALRNAGVDAVNVSLDALEEDAYEKLTGANALQKVLSGIDAALHAGLRLRVNSVLLRGQNEAQAEKLIALARDIPVDVRFIELMPFSEAGRNSAAVIRAEELLERFSFLTPVPAKSDDPSVAKYYTAPGFCGQIGFITPVSDKFCDQCNRIRLLSDGTVRPCLGHERTYDLKPVLHDDKKLREVIRRAIYEKPAGHNFECAYGNLHAMNKIGG